MEKLTFDGNFCDIAQCRELPCPHGGSCTQRKVWERLKAYEDTGLTPEEVSDALAEADKAGRLMVLPCKPGDILWTFSSYPIKQVYSFQVCSFTATDIRTPNGRVMMNTSRCGVIDARAVGKTVFLTREEAEKALEAMK